jgi:hypothetical protein
MRIDALEVEFQHLWKMVQSHQMEAFFRPSNNHDSINSNQQTSKVEEIGGQPLDLMEVEDLEPLLVEEENEAQGHSLN